MPTLILITSGTLSTTTQEIAFTSIPQTYKHLLVKGTMHSNRSAGNDGGLNLRFNDTATSYDYENIYCTGSTINAQGGTAYSETYIQAVGVSQDTQNVSLFAPYEMTIPNYANASRYKSIIGTSANVPPNVNGAAGLLMGFWQNTNAITKLVLRTNGFGSSSFVANTTYYLYGIE